MAHQIHRSPAYLSRNQHCYCFRIRIPKDVQPYFGKKELRYSLGTGYVGKAKSEARRLAGNVQLLIQQVRSSRSKHMDLTDQEIQQLVVQYLNKIKAGYDQPVGPDVIPPFDDEAGLHGYMDSLDGIKSDLQVEIATGDYERVRDEAHALLEDILTEADTRGIDESSKGFLRLCEGLIRAEIKGIDYHKDRLSGEYRDDLEQAMDNAFAPTRVNIIKPSMATPQPVPNEGPLLSDVLDEYKNEKKRGWTEKSTEEIVDGSLALFKGIVGDVPIQSIDRKKVSEFKHKILRLPSNMNKKPAYRDKSIVELLEMEIEEVLAPRTVNKHLGRVRTFFKWAIDNGEFEGANPAPKGLNIPLDSDADDKRAPYSIDDLANIFTAEGYTKDSFSRSYMFWTPIIAVFHGMRQNEIAQLGLSDIKRVDDGTWVFDVNNLGDKRVKTDPSQRLVPIHPFLIDELNVLKLKRNLMKEGHDRLFPEIKPTRDGYGAPVSKWFNERFKHTIELEADERDRWKDFHSFRKTFSSYLLHKDIPDKKVKQVVGHSTGGDVLNRHYFEKFKGKQLLNEVVSKIDFHKRIDLSHLKDSRFVPE